MHLEKGKELKQVKGDGRPFKYTHKLLGTNEINIKYQIIIFRSKHINSPVVCAADTRIHSRFLDLRTTHTSNICIYAPTLRNKVSPCIRALRISRFYRTDYDGCSAIIRSE